MIGEFLGVYVYLGLMIQQMVQAAFSCLVYWQIWCRSLNQFSQPSDALKLLIWRCSAKYLAFVLIMSSVRSWLLNIAFCTQIMSAISCWGHLELWFLMVFTSWESGTIANYFSDCFRTSEIVDLPHLNSIASSQFLDMGFCFFWKQISFFLKCG